MRTRSEADRLFAARADAVKVQNLLPAVLAEAGQAVSPDGGMSPAEILRDLQERQAASVITATMPGPQAWGAYELPLPGGSQGRPGQAVKGDPLTPQHSAAEGAIGAGDDEDAERRERVQHLADPYPPDVPEVAEVDLAELGKLSKAFRDAFSAPSGYPPMRLMDAEAFRRPPVTAGHEADSPGYAPPGQAVPVPSATLALGMLTRPPLSDGHSRAAAPEAC